jgi:glyoxylase-like metal-dependent hydrolase (beta-lactamase superfamily II)
MIFRQFRVEKLGQASYLLGCVRAKEGIVVDPIADLGADFYLMEAADRGLAIVHVLETHIHADYASCARGLAEASGADHHLFHSAPVRYSFAPLRDREILDIGKVQVQVMATPGHTPEHVSYLVTDRARSEEPWFVLTGDSLFVGDVGRLDLLLGDQAVDVIDETERARLQYQSIRNVLFSLPDHVEVYPGHYGGSACGGVNMSGKVSSTIYFEKKYNLAMQQPDEAAFARFVRENVRPFPENYARLKSYNLGLTGLTEQEPAHA